MQIRNFFVFLLFTLGLLITSCNNNSNPTNRITALNSDWVLLKENTLVDTVQFPFSLIETLYLSQDIEDPNYEDDHQKIMINPEEYSLKKEFNISPASIQNNQIKLHIGGVNGHADILINDSIVNTSTSYYTSQDLLLNPYLHAGANFVSIKFKKTNAKTNHPDFQHGTKQNVSHNNIGCLNTIRLSEIKNITFQKPFLDYSSYKENTLEAFWNIPIESELESDITIEWNFNGKVYRIEEHVKKGTSLQTLYFPIENPMYWFPYSDGNPHLYKGELNLFKDGQLLQKQTIDFGVKHLKWKNNNNQIEFILNGKSIKIFAIDYNKPNWYKWATQEEVKTYISDLKTLGINCVRVSGKEDYLREDILELFDKAGIFVWQDLHYTKLPKTWTVETKLNIQREMINLCETYRNHPSVLSLGGKSENHADTTKNAGLIHYEIFEQVIPKVVNAFSHLEYIPNASFVWNDEPEHFSSFSMSSYEFLDVWLREKNKDPFENAWISKMPSEDVAHDYYNHVFSNVGSPVDIESMIYYSELLQLNYIDSILSVKRGLNPNTIHLPVSYGESGPGIHPTITDYFGYHKALFYMLYKLNQPLSIRKAEKDGITSYLLYNNTSNTISENVRVYIKNKTGQIVDQLNQTVSVLPGQEKPILEWETSIIPKLWLDEQNRVLEFEFANQLERVLLNFDSAPIPYPDFKYRVITQSDHQILELLSNSFIPYSKIKTNHIGYFSTNFVTLLPQDTLKIPFNSQDNTYPLTSDEVEIFNYYQSFE